MSPRERKLGGRLVRSAEPLLRSEAFNVGLEDLVLGLEDLDLGLGAPLRLIIMLEI